MSLLTISKILIGLGIGFVIIGLLVFGFTKLNLPFGQLPGDITFQWGNTKFFFPLATSIILSILLTLGINILIRFLNK